MSQKNDYLVMSSRRNLCSLNLDEYKQIKVTNRVLYRVIDIKDLMYDLIDSLVSKKILSTKNEEVEDPILNLFLTLILRSLDPEFNNYRFAEWVFPFDFWEKKEIFGYYNFEGIQDKSKKIMVMFCEDKDLGSTDISPDQNIINNISVEIQALPAFIFKMLKLTKDLDFKLFEEFRRGLEIMYVGDNLPKEKVDINDSNVNELKERENLIRVLTEIKKKLASAGKSFSLKAAADLLPLVGRSTLYEWISKAGLEYDSKTKTIIDKKTRQKVL